MLKQLFKKPRNLKKINNKEVFKFFKEFSQIVFVIKKYRRAEGENAARTII